MGRAKVAAGTVSVAAGTVKGGAGTVSGAAGTVSVTAGTVSDAAGTVLGAAAARSPQAEPDAPGRSRTATPAEAVTASRPTLHVGTTAVASERDADDLRLCKRARAGDRDSAVVLYRRYVSEIYGYFWNQTANSQDAEDLTSETFLRVVRSLSEFEGRSSFRTWLYEIARNQLKDFWRLRSRRPVGVSLDAAAFDMRSEPGPPQADDISEPRADDNSEPRAAGARTRAILNALPETYRTVLTLRILESRSVKETADAMGKTENHVKVLTHRALKLAARIGETLSVDGTAEAKSRQAAGAAAAESGK